MADKARFFAGLLLVAVGLSSCGGDDPETRLRATIDAMEAAIEAREPGDFVAHVAEDFSGGGGQFDRRTLRTYLAGQMMGGESISVTLAPLDVTLHEGGRATVRVSALVLGGRFLPERGEALEIVSGWRLEDGEWRCYTADWKG